LNRRANTPDGSGGASPTITASRQDDDLMADHDQDTQSADVMATPARTPATPVPAMPAPPGQDASPNGGPSAEDNGKADPAGAESAVTTTTTTTDAAPALPADSIGSPRASSASIFTRPSSAPASPAAKDPEPTDKGEAPAAETAAPAGPDTRSPIDRAAFRPASAAEPAADTPSPAVPPRPEPSPAAVSAAAFAWAAPDPPPTSPSSPAQNYRRSSADTQASAAPSAPAAPSGPAEPAAGRAAAPARSTPRKRAAQRPARQAHLTVARVEPWSVMKFSFVMSLVAFVILFVAVTVLYGTLSALGVFESLQRVVASVTSSQNSAGVNAAKWFTASRVLGYTGLLGSLDIVLITAVATIGAVIYNLTSRLIGGVEVTLRETE
jgi:Transmembrane domain of unknown function (DUF3566)